MSWGTTDFESFETGEYGDDGEVMCVLGHLMKKKLIHVIEGGVEVMKHAGESVLEHQLRV